jgi:dihydroneopterin aldolase
MNSRDVILLRDVELPVRIGVTENERAAWQSLTADVSLTLGKGFDEMPDELGATLDYEYLSKQMKALAAERPRQLLETLAAEMVRALLQHELAAEAEVELRKRVLPGVGHSAVRMKRGKAPSKTVP